MQNVVFTLHTSDNNGEVHGSIDSQKTDCAAIIVSIVTFQLLKQFQCFWFGGSGKCSCRKSSRKKLQRMMIVQPTDYFLNQVNHMTELLNFLVSCNFYFTAILAQIITCQINEHGVFSIFFFVVNKLINSGQIVCFGSCFSHCSGNRVNRSNSFFELNLRFG